MPKTTEKPTGCIHHWEIETAQGSHSRGICKICKEEKVFENSILTKQIALSIPRDDGRIGIVIS